MVESVMLWRLRLMISLWVKQLSIWVKFRTINKYIWLKDHLKRAKELKLVILLQNKVKSVIVKWNTPKY